MSSKFLKLLLICFIICALLTTTDAKSNNDCPKIIHLSYVEKKDKKKAPKI